MKTPTPLLWAVARALALPAIHALRKSLHAISQHHRRLSVGLAKQFRGLNPVHCVVLGYASYVALGCVLLWMPVSHTDKPIHFVDALFTAASATSTTGLVTVSTGDDYNFFGQLVIIALIQFGGLGYMTISSFTILSVSGRLSHARKNISALAMGLPQGFEPARFVRNVCVFTFIIEAVGAAALFFVFEAHGAPNPLWQAIFHSISAFCTAGFGLFNDSFESYRTDVSLNLIVIILSYAGAIGFIVIDDVWEVVRRRRQSITLTSRIILASTFVISLVGTVLFAVDEPTIQQLPAGQRWLAAWFQVMTASTTVGFNTIPIGTMSASSVLLIIIVMIIGASPAGTGGGVKTTSITALWAVWWSTLRGREQITFARRQIPEPRVRAAVANVTFYCTVMSIGIYTFSLVEKAPLPDLIFECASAIGTVGLSRGITPSLTLTGKLIIIAMMFFGRVGPITLAMALMQPWQHKRRDGIRNPAPHSLHEDVAI